jgi:hypothetical protein
VQVHAVERFADVIVGICGTQTRYLVRQHPCCHRDDWHVADRAG